MKNDRVNSMKLVPGQIIACTLQEVHVDAATDTFYFPFQEKPSSKAFGLAKLKKRINEGGDAPIEQESTG